MHPLTVYIEGFRHALANGGSLPASARMDVDGAGSIHIAEGEVSDRQDPAACIMRTSHEIYDQLYFGTIDPTIAFAKGDLSINGDMAVALAMQGLFEKARAA
ncbi:SCP2 sterol-binding domain-containing protein [Erythrobacter mangrovi]|uniref:SCP2 sterol-binding domain-containing protein n=1 Tax=Erythrobacter mangrovi TaxID=2739433 RepID=A0A7D4BA66_9SPHN|nr:SCP2 sterol-binding domain-containing protein [Erythrobacter mangrovi]QKG70646.1 SCP2 sterol-binding domain-containing protein [Erythrobacter mangrovi]